MTDLITQIRDDRKAGTPGPWGAIEVVNFDGGPKTLYELGKYAEQSLNMVAHRRFLFISGNSAIAHIGYGEAGPCNVRRIARVPEMEQTILDQAEEIARLREVLKQARIAALKEAADIITSNHEKCRRVSLSYSGRDAAGDIRSMIEDHTNAE